MEHASLTVLITRPKEEAESLAHTLAEIGVTPIMCPMLDIIYTPNPPIIQKLLETKHVQAIIFTSKHGVHSVAEIDNLHAIPALCVGEATALAAKEQGFLHVTDTGGDVPHLQTFVQQHYAANLGSLLYFSGEHIAQDLSGILMTQGYDIQQCITYEANACTLLPDAALQSLQRHDVDIVLFYSARTAKTFETLLTSTGHSQLASFMSVLCLSPAIAAGLQLSWKEKLTATAPTNASMLASIEKFRVYK